MFYAVKSSEVKVRTEFPNVWGEYKHHSNPLYTQYYVIMVACGMHKDGMHMVACTMVVYNGSMHDGI